MQRSCTASCVELNIDVREGRYLATIQVDGLLKQRRVFQTAIEVSDWTAAIFCTTDRDLYVHLRAPAGADHGHLVLDLAGKLARQGLMIGITEEESVCRAGNRRLQ